VFGSTEQVWYPQKDFTCQVDFVSINQDSGEIAEEQYFVRWFRHRNELRDGNRFHQPARAALEQKQCRINDHDGI